MPDQEWRPRLTEAQQERLETFKETEKEPARETFNRVFRMAEELRHMSQEQ